MCLACTSIDVYSKASDPHLVPLRDESYYQGSCRLLTDPWQIRRLAKNLAKMLPFHVAFCSFLEAPVSYAALPQMWLGTFCRQFHRRLQACALECSSLMAHPI
ncbi:hypothetical protein PoB_001901900 [Plakobranchus ocellatus]|uniref:Uncharacterized protein n=1 Tax=Plakobranchus ocellatus TaxID=259542 RepID=A0AAV3ZF68_9GAST|nr:hypothetical protein PoB_001901900 [Plakobranchus ocellatus]